MDPFCCFFVLSVCLSYCLVFLPVILSCLFIAALWSPAGKGFPKRFFFCESFVLFMSCIYHAFVSVHCCLVVTYWERADLLVLVYDV